MKGNALTPSYAGMLVIGMLVALLAGARDPSVASAVSGDAVTFPSAASGQGVTGVLHRPDGSGPFPAIVLLHHCAGIAPYHVDYAEWLTGLGYVTVLVDSFTPRHQSRVCGQPAAHPTPTERAADAYGALFYLRSLPFVDGNRIGLVGWSHGGSSVLRTSSQSVRARLGIAGKVFRAGVAFYPGCRSLPDDPAIPLLILTGTADDWTPAAVCAPRVAALQQTGRPVTLATFPGAFHSFDNDRLGSRTVIALGRYTLRYNADATKRAHEDLEDFLARYLR